MRTIKLTKVISSAGYAISVILLAAFSVASTASPARNPDIRVNKPALSATGSYAEAATFGPRTSAFGDSIAIWQDKVTGTYWSVVGSTADNNYSGAAYVYSKTSDASSWKEEAKLAGDDEKEGDNFGFAVAIEDQTIVVSAYSAVAPRAAVYVFVKDAMSGNWLQQKELSIAALSEFGHALSLSGDSLAVGDPDNDQVYIYDRAGGSWNLSQQFGPPVLSRTSFVSFGASIQLCGDSLIVGAYGESEIEANEGAAYIYTRKPDKSFSDPAILHAPSPAANESFGYAVGLNGSIAAVAAVAAVGRNDNMGGVDTFAYDDASGAWNFVSAIVASDMNFRFLGSSLSLDSGTLAVGTISGFSPTTDTYGIVNVYVSAGDPGSWTTQASLSSSMGPMSSLGYPTAVSGNLILSGRSVAEGLIDDFYRQDGSWHAQAPIFDPNGSDDGEKFGTAVSISGNFAVMTASGEPSADFGITQVATVYAKDPTGLWNLAGELPDAEIGYESIGFHACNPVITDGNRIFIGIPDENSSQGAVHVYVKDADSWAEETTLVASDGAAGDLFGCSISTSADRVLIGAPGRNHYEGAGYTFTVASGSWNEESMLTSTDGAANDYLGNSAFLSGDTAVLGAPFRNGSTGTAFVFARSVGTWNQSANLSAKDVATGDEFGATVAIAGDSVIVGSPNKTVSMNAGAGGAYVFRQSGSSWVEQEKFEGDSANAYLGSSISASTSRMIIGVPGANAVQIYDDTSGSWELYSTAGGSYSTSSFGSAVGISGTTIIVGAPTTGAHKGGEAFIFTDTDVILADSFE